MVSFLRFLSFGLVAICASASPQAQKRQSSVYSLTISTKDNDSLNGETVEIFNSVLGVYTGDRAAAEVYPIAEASGHSSLHTYPIGIVDHVLDLEGDNGLYTLTDRANIGSGTDGSFSANFIVKDGLITQDLKGGWVAFPSTDGWTIKWYDGTAIVTLNYVHVDIVYKSIGGY